MQALDRTSTASRRLHRSTSRRPLARAPRRLPSDPAVSGPGPTPTPTPPRAAARFGSLPPPPPHHHPARRAWRIGPSTGRYRAAPPSLDTARRRHSGRIDGPWEATPTPPGRGDSAGPASRGWLIFSAGVAGGILIFVPWLGRSGEVPAIKKALLAPSPDNAPVAWQWDGWKAGKDLGRVLLIEIQPKLSAYVREQMGATGRFTV